MRLEDESEPSAQPWHPGPFPSMATALHDVQTNVTTMSSCTGGGESREVSEVSIWQGAGQGSFGLAVGLTLCPSLVGLCHSDPDRGGLEFGDV